MSVAHENALRSAEAALRAADLDGARRALLALDWSQCPRPLLQAAAKACRRAGLIAQGLKALSPVVRGLRGSRARATVDPTPGERAEYAVLLQRSGAVREALRLLQSVDARAFPDADLYLAYGLFAVWDYQASLEPLRRYVSEAREPYSALVGRVNLMAALCATGRHDEVDASFALVVEEARRREAARLEGNGHEILAQSLIARGRLDSAEAALDRAARLLRANEGLEGLFVAKWKAVLHDLRHERLERIPEFRSTAVLFGDGESVREADLFALKVRPDEADRRRLHFGTPFQAYRTRIARELGLPEPEGAHLYDARDGRTIADEARCRADMLVLDLTDPSEGTAPATEPGEQLHRVLRALVADAYRPQTLGSLFAGVWPDEHFDPYSSPDRVHQALRRARRWLESSKIPAAIEERNGSWRLVAMGPLAIRTDGELEAPTPEAALLKRLRARTGERPFSAREARDLLGLSESSWLRFVSRALERGWASRSGAGPSVRYRLASSALNKIDLAG